MINTIDDLAFAGFPSDSVITEEMIEAKVQELLSQLTLDEKLTMMDGDKSSDEGHKELMLEGYAAHSMDAGIIPRLGIPGIRFIDGPRGVIISGATTFPVSMARGATWDLDLEERIGEAIGQEVRALGANLYGGVCINVLRHPAWGRAQETYGEDPYSLGEFGAALTRGVQQHAMACVKHYALNSMENARFKVDVTVKPRALHEIYLRHFKRVVDAGVASVMSSYNSVNGEWAGQNKTLLTDILKKKWKFNGFVLTDFGLGMRDAKKAALAGQDLEMPFQMHYHANLKCLVENGEVPVEQINDAVSRLLRQQIRLLRPGIYRRDIAGCEKHRAIARETAAKSIVLLKNDEQLLPLHNVQKMAVIGRLADTPNTGDGGSSNTHPTHVVTPLEGIKAAFKGEIEVLYDDGSDLERAKTVAQKADSVILVVGYTFEDEGEYGDQDDPLLAELMGNISREDLQEQTGEGHQLDLGPQGGGDRDHLTLHDEDEELIQAIAKVNSNTIVAIMGGSSVIMENWKSLVPTILMLWYPGMEGGHALADILLGKVSPSGKLPVIFPASSEDLPYYDKNATEIEYDMWHGYRKLERDGRSPAFPFGFGLSYTNFAYSNLSIPKDQWSSTDTIEISFDVTNTGTYAGDEVAQVYISPIESAVERAPKELKAFTRIKIEPGETKAVKIDLPLSRLAYYDEIQEDFIVEPIEYQLFIGTHSLDSKALKASFVAHKSC